MKALAIIATEAVSGPGRQLAALANRMHTRGVDFHVAVVHRGSADDSRFLRYLEAAGVQHHFIRDRGPIDVMALGELRRLIGRIDPDVIQTHSYKATALMWALRKLGEKRQWIGCFHGATAERRRATLYHKLDHMMLAHADAIVVMSASQRAGFDQRPDKLRVIYNAVVTSGSGTTPPAPGEARLGYIGRLSYEKGVDVLLESCRILRDRRCDFTLRIAGEGPERASLEAQTRLLEMTRHVQFIGPVADPQTLYRDLDVVILPSRSEGLPNVALEALAADVPLVVTNVGAVPEVISDRAAWLIEPEKPVELADAIAAAIQNGRTPAATQARRDVVERLSLDQRVDEHLALYRMLFKREVA